MIHEVTPEIQSTALIQILLELARETILPQHLLSMRLSGNTNLSDLILDSVAVAALLTELEIRFDLQTAEGDFHGGMNLDEMATVLQRIRHLSSSAE